MHNQTMNFLFGSDAAALRVAVTSVDLRSVCRCRTAAALSSERFLVPFMSRSLGDAIVLSVRSFESPSGFLGSLPNTLCLSDSRHCRCLTTLFSYTALQPHTFTVLTHVHTLESLSSLFFARSARG